MAVRNRSAKTAVTEAALLPWELGMIASGGARRIVRAIFGSQESKSHMCKHVWGTRIRIRTERR